MSAQPHAFLKQRLSSQTREYLAAQSIAFLKTKEAFGGLSNMASGYPLVVNGIAIRSSEALYQACRFPHLPEVQQRIISQTSPMTAKMVSKPFRAQSRADWEQIKVNVMRWCLRVKLAQNRHTFGALLLATGDLAIVEKSYKDSYWGAKPSADEQAFVGMNVLGRLLMELREELRTGKFDQRELIQPLNVADFCLYGQWIEPIKVSSVAMSIKKSVNMDSLSLPMAQANAVVEPMIKARSLVAGLKPYYEYKETNIAWIKRIPKHWLVYRAKVLFKKMSRSVESNSEVVTCFRDGIVTLRKNRRLRGFTESLKEIGYQGVKKGDLVIHVMDAFAGAIGVSDSDGKSTPVYLVCAPQSILVNTHYYSFLVREMARNQWIISLAKGIRERSTDFRFDIFANQILPVPPLEEQNNIVAFINYANHKIDQYIRAKKKLIKLLNEQKQVIIHQAVTRGLNPDVKLKESGIEWLGKIPEHWSTRKIKYLARLSGGMTPNKNNHNYWHGDIPWVSPKDMKKTELYDSIDHITLQALKETNAALLKESHILIVVRGMILARIFPVSVNRVPITINQDIKALKPRLNIITVEYLALVLEGLQKEILQLIEESGHGTCCLRTDELVNFSLPIPSTHAEQAKIIEYVNKKTISVQKQIEKTNIEIQLLQEYRTRLISDVVTGQLDVQAAAQQLPELNTLTLELINTLDDADELTDDEAELIPEDQADGDGYQ